MPAFPVEPAEAGFQRPEEPRTDVPQSAYPSAEPPTLHTPRGAALRWTLPTCLLAWLVPGCGHLLVGRWGRALVFGVLIAALFFGGLALDGKVYRPIAGDPLSYLAALGASGVGSLYMAVHALDMGAGDVGAPYHEYGNTFTLVAGLLNLLVILDAFDAALLRARASRSKREGVASAA